MNTKYTFKTLRLPNYCPVLKSGYDGNQSLGIPATPAIRAKFTDGSYVTYDDNVARLLRENPRYGIEFVEDEDGSVKAPKAPGPNNVSISFDGKSPKKEGGAPVVDIKEMIKSEAMRIVGEIMEVKLKEREEAVRAEYSSEQKRIHADDAVAEEVVVIPERQELDEPKAPPNSVLKADSGKKTRS
jgi:hypothetical protein